MKLLIYICIAVYILFCDYNTVVAQKETQNYIIHELVVDGKKISFSLPNYYSDTYTPSVPFIGSRWSGYKKKYIYYSTENDNNSFSFLICDDSLGVKGEKMIDYYIYNLVKEFAFNVLNPMIPFIEKKKDNKGHIYYLLMSSCIDTLEREHIFNLEEKHLVYSHFAYITYFGSERYQFILETRDKIGDFSYEEKEKILESINIE